MTFVLRMATSCPFLSPPKLPFALHPPKRQKTSAFPRSGRNNNFRGNKNNVFKGLILSFSVMSSQQNGSRWLTPAVLMFRSSSPPRSALPRVPSSPHTLCSPKGPRTPWTIVDSCNQSIPPAHPSLLLKSPAYCEFYITYNNSPKSRRSECGHG